MSGTMFLEFAEANMGPEFSYSMAFGYLLESTRAFLRGETSRDFFTAQFAQVELVQSLYASSIGVGGFREAFKAALDRARETAANPDQAAEVAAPPLSP